MIHTVKIFGIVNKAVVNVFLELAYFFYNPVKVKSLSCVQLFATPWTLAHQAPSSMVFSRQEYWSGLPFPSPRDLPNPGIKPQSPALQADALPAEPPGIQWMLAIWSLVPLPFLNPAWLSRSSQLKPGLENFEHYFASMWECNCAVVWTFFGTAFLWDLNENWPFPVLWPLLSFPNLLAYWVQHFHSIIF